MRDQWGPKNHMYGRHHTEEAKKRIGEKNRTYRHTEKAKMAISRSHQGSNNGMWAGDNAKNAGLHLWIRTRLVKPSFCQICNIKPPHDLANITGIYSRDLKNWMYLCRRCHMDSDGRLATVGANRNPRTGRIVSGQAAKVKTFEEMTRK